MHFLVRPPTSEKVLYQSVLLHFVLNSENKCILFKLRPVLTYSLLTWLFGIMVKFLGFH